VYTLFQPQSPTKSRGGFLYTIKEAVIVHSPSLRRKHSSLLRGERVTPKEHRRSMPLLSSKTSKKIQTKTN